MTNWKTVDAAIRAATQADGASLPGDQTCHPPDTAETADTDDAADTADEPPCELTADQAESDTDTSDQDDPNTSSDIAHHPL